MITNYSFMQIQNGYSELTSYLWIDLRTHYFYLLNLKVFFWVSENEEALQTKPTLYCVEYMERDWRVEFESSSVAKEI